MTKLELEMLFDRFDAMQADIKESKNDIKALDIFIREHMNKEEVTMHKVDKRLSKLEWKAHGFATAFGIIGGVIATKLKAVFGTE